MICLKFIPDLVTGAFPQAGITGFTTGTEAAVGIVCLSGGTQVHHRGHCEVNKSF